MHNYKHKSPLERKDCNTFICYKTLVINHFLSGRNQPKVTPFAFDFFAKQLIE